MTNDINTFLNSMVEAKRALDAEPGYQRQIDELRSTTARQGDTIQRLELKLMDRSGQITELQTKVREVEAQRDDAGFRLLESEDRVSNLSTLLRLFVSDALKTLAVVEGAEPSIVVSEADARELHRFRDDRELVGLHMKELEDKQSELIASVEAQAQIMEHRQGIITDLEGKLQRALYMPKEALEKPLSPGTPQEFVLDLEADLAGYQAAQSSHGEDQMQAYLGATGESLGGERVRPADPLAETQSGERDGPFASSSPLDESPTAGEAVSESASTATNESNHVVKLGPNPSAPYSGIYYKDYPRLVSRADWLAGGGTEESYGYSPPKFSSASHNS